MYREFEHDQFITCTRNIVTDRLFICRPGGIPARNAKGERLLLFIGIIDILQSYRLKKKLEHTWKSMIHDGVSFNQCYITHFRNLIYYWYLPFVGHGFRAQT